MSQENSKSDGRISGKAPSPQSSDGGRIGGGGGKGPIDTGKIAGSDLPGESSGPSKSVGNNQGFQAGNLRERIMVATQSGGLTQLPDDFGDSHGDWKIIESENYFELLYLDYRHLNQINPGLVARHFELVEKFWKEKRNLWQSGSGQVRKSIEDKYGQKNLDQSLKKLGAANERLFTLEKIIDYNDELRRRRMFQAEEKLGPLLRMMTKNGDAEPNEIEGIFEEGMHHDVDREEIAEIVKKVIIDKNFKPYGTITGTLLSEQLVSVTWMNDEKLKIAQADAEAKKKSGREIFENIYAHSVEEIGEIIFNNESLAKRDIADGLLKNSIDYFSTVKARQFVDIVNAQKNPHLQYLQIAYRLNPRLPYRFRHDLLLKSTDELTRTVAASLENFKTGSEQFKNGHVEAWLFETNRQDYEILKQIKETAPNKHLAFIEFIFRFNPGLPYLFRGTKPISTPKQLSDVICESPENWEAARFELFDGSLTTWLRVSGKIPDTRAIQETLATHAEFPDLALEKFVRQLNPDLAAPSLEADMRELSYPHIESGMKVVTTVVLKNITRGYVEATTSLSQALPGVSIKPQSFFIKNISGKNHAEIILEIDSVELLKGNHYKTSIEVNTSDNQRISIPLSFEIVFPKRAVIRQTLKFAGVGALLFLLTRLMINVRYPSWLNESKLTFVDWNIVQYYYKNIGLFGVAFFLFIGMTITSLYFLVKYLRK